MVRKRDLITSARIVSYIGGVLYILGAALLFLNHFIPAFELGYVGTRVIIYLFGLSFNGDILVLAIVGVVIGGGIIILLGAETSHLLTGILLIVLAAIGLGIPAIPTFAGAILYLIAYTKKR